LLPRSEIRDTEYKHFDTSVIRDADFWYFGRPECQPQTTTGVRKKATLVKEILRNFRICIHCNYIMLKALTTITILRHI